jgi:hypothetical protein
VVPGGYAGFLIQTEISADPGCMGNGPLGPFRGFVVKWVNGPEYPLPGFTLTLACGWAPLYAWQIITDPLPSIGTVTRAPMPTNSPSP